MYLLLYYLIPIATLGTAIFINVYRKYNSLENHRYSEKVEFIIRPSYSLLIITPLVCWFGFVFSHIAQDAPAWMFAIGVTVLVLFLNYLMLAKWFFWVHFLDKHLVISYPLQNILCEISLSQITSAGYKAQGRSSYYFIQFDLNGIQKVIKIHHFATPDWQFRKYFQSRNINYTRVS